MLRADPTSLAFALALALITLAPTAALAIAPTETDPRAVIRAVDDRKTGDHLSALLTMRVADPNGRERVRSLRTRALEVEGGRKTVMMFESPADVRNVGVLSFDWHDERADDQWLYLPSVAKATRLSSADRSGAFLGSDLSYADMTERPIDAYDYTMLQPSISVDGDDCWLIESKPKTAHERDETGYQKTQLWVSKSKLVPIQVKAWFSTGSKVKLMKLTDFEQIGDVWVAKKQMVRTVDGDGKPLSTTTLLWSELRLDDPGVSADDFTERRLERGL